MIDNIKSSNVMTKSNTAQLSTPSNTTTAPTAGNKETTDSVRFTTKLAHNSIKARCNNRIQTFSVYVIVTSVTRPSLSNVSK